MTNSPEPTPSTSSSGSFGLACLYLFVLLIGGAFAFGGYGVLTDHLTNHRWADFSWGVGALINGATILLAGVSALIYLKTRGQATWRTTFALLAFSVGLSLVLAGIGVVMTIQAKARGGDWGALQVGVTRMFCVLLPIIFAGILAIAATCHIRSRPDYLRRSDG
jgi:hypothetical protein